MAKLKPRARIIRTIGDQLISGPEAALIELVKNSYDADATWVKIKIAPPCNRYPTGVVRIQDNGHGMTTDEIESKWFEPATDEKKINKLSRSGQRRLLGAKGIGRFASARLGTETFIVSRSIIEGNEFQKSTLTINWNDFESNKYLDELDIPITTKKGDINKGSGFYVKVTNLKVLWTKNSINKIIKELRKVISPQDIEGKFDIFLDLSYFKQTKDKNNPSSFDGNELLKNELVDGMTKEDDVDADPQLILPYKIQRNSDYLLSGNFDNLGNFIGVFTIERGDNVPQKIAIASPKLEDDENECGAFDIILKIYDRESDSVLNLFKRMGINNIKIREARNILNNNSGIAIYRSGFRIRPYGEPDNDWLTLEQRRVQDPSKKIGHSQISGKILIKDEELSNLIERSSREGFEHNESFLRLKNLITHTLVRIEEKRFEYRDKAGLSRSAKNDVGKIKDIAKLSKLVAASKDLPVSFQKKFVEAIEKESIELTKLIEELEAYQKLLESRSALSFVVAQVLHDGRRYLGPMTDASNSLIEHKDKIFEASALGEVIRKYYPLHAETIKTGVKGLSSLFKALDPISGRKRGKAHVFNVKEATEVAVNLMGDLLIENGVDLTINIDTKTSLYGYLSDYQNALLNIIDNAIHWLSTTNNDEKAIVISSTDLDGLTNIIIENNGPIIEDFFISRLFIAGSTLKSDGHGLGLVIAREACRANKGDLFYDDTASKTTFVIQFQKGEK